MREALAGLTVRGRAFLAAGVTAIVCAVILGQPALTRVGVLVAALPLVTAAVIGRSRYRLALVRTVNPQLVTAGQPVRVDLSLTNEGRTPSGVLRLEDHVPYVLGTRPRFVLEGIGHGWRRHVTYHVRSDVRGQFDIGPMSVRVSDPFGLVELGRAFQTTVPLTVTPRTVSLPQIPLGGAWTGSGDNRPRAFATGSAEDVTVREYRRGDDLRRVHWRSSARVGELMVRREEQPWQSRATLFLDNRLRAHRGQGIASSLEAAVSTAASIAVHLSLRGFTVRLVTASGEDPSSAWHFRASELNTGPLLETLAVVQADPRPRIDTGWLAEPTHGGLMVAVVGSLEPQDIPVLRRMQHHSASAMALALDVDAWVARSTAGGAATDLTRQGWRAAALGPRDRLDSVWQELGRSTAHVSRSGHVSTGDTGFAPARDEPAMTPARGGFAGGFALAAAAAGTTWLALLSWRGFTEQPVTFLGPLLVLGAVIAGTGAVARWARLSAPLVVLCQVVVSGALASTMLSGSPIPVGPAWERLQGSFADALLSAERYAAPLPSHVAPVDPILIAGGFGCLLLVDFLACTLRRAPLAGLPLLTVYSVPVSILLGGVSWVVFAATAGGFLLMLFLQESEQVARWGRPLGDDATSDPSAFGVSTGAIRATAGTIGGVATALAVFLPLLIPTLDLSVFRGGLGQGGEDIEVTNPMTDLRRDLQRGDDIPLVQVRTTDPDPSYLRISVLTRFSFNEWTSGTRQVPTNQLAQGAVPALQGVARTVARTETEYDVAMTPSFRSIWLPTQAPISRITADGDWRYDRETMDFLAGDEGLDTAGLSYSMTGVELDLSAESMARAPSTGGLVSSDYIDLPDGIPSTVSNLAFQVTRNEDTRFEKAVALQEWFREDGGFTYDLDASPGNGADDLVEFLTEGEGGRTGYCEQFASAMAVLARILGVPARVAVGFYQPRKIGRQTWEYSAWDLHAWPELFFPGSGWVRFEPTPPRRAADVPGYTTEQVNLPESAGGPGLPRQSELLPSRGESSSASGEDAAEANGERDGQGGFPWAPVLGAGGVVLLALGLLLVPSLVRRARTRSRVGGGPEAAWAELLDTATDLGVAWPFDRSPRETRDALVDSFGLPVRADTPERPVHGAHIAPFAVEALDRIVLCVERLRYARAGQETDASRLDKDLATCVASLQGGATRAARRRANWLPRSVLRRRRPVVPAPEVEPLTVRYGGVVDHVG